MSGLSHTLRGEAGANRFGQSGGRRAWRGKSTGDHQQERAVAAASRRTGPAPGQMLSNRRGLFRRKLVIQIFPQSIDDLSTFHSRHPSQGSGRPAGYALLNSAPPPEVPPGMSPRARNVTLLVLMGFVAFLLWSTLSSQRVECAVAVEFQGRSDSATASGASEEDAAREAQTAACGPITGSMNDRVACSRLRPVSRICRTL